jgi:hypothetical protein
MPPVFHLYRETTLLIRVERQSASHSGAWWSLNLRSISTLAGDDDRPRQTAALHGKRWSSRTRCHDETLFIRWVARATGANGRPIEHAV